MKKLIPIVTFLFLMSCSPIINPDKTHDINGNEYESVLINNQEWLTTNLKSTKFNNGDDIFQSKSFSDWETSIKNKTPTWCYFNFDSTSNNILYNYYCIIDNRNIAIDGWEVPSFNEYKSLEKYLDEGLERLAGYKMKSKTGWDPADYDNGTFEMNGSNESLFNAKPVGILWSDSFSGKAIATGWWCGLSQYPGSYFTLQWAYGNELFDKVNDDLSFGLSIRLIKKN